jgi:D-aminopeptidase
LIGNDDMTVLFQAVEEATQEAIYNSLFMATRVRGFQGHTAEAISLDDLLRIMSKFNRLRKKT